MKKIWIAMVGILLLLGVWQLSRPGSSGHSPSGPAGPGVQAPEVPSGEVEGGPSRIDRRSPEEIAAEAPAPEAPPERCGSLRVRAVWEGEGSAASGVAIFFFAAAEPALDRNPLRVVSDADGVAHVPRLRAGKVRLGSDRGGKAETIVEPGSDSELRFELPRGVIVAGEVVDGAGKAVPDAGIWLSTHEKGWLAGRVVARADAQGRFRVLGVDPEQSLGALAPGYAPSDLVDLETLDSSAQPVQVHLILSRTGATIEGRVTRPGGQPVEGALVAFGRYISPVYLMSGMRERWSPLVVRSDAEGLFRCENVAPGKVPVSVRAEGFAPWLEERSPIAGEQLHVEVLLDPGVTVRGTVRGADGAPAPGARVMAVVEPFGEDRLEWMGPPRARGAFGRPSALSDDAGGYVLHRVPSGAVHLFAIVGKGSHHRDEYGGRDQVTLHAGPGEELRWNPRVSLGLLIRGRIETADGEAPDFFSVMKAAPETPGARPKQSSWDLEGRFQFAHCEDVPYTLVVSRGSGEPVRKSGVRPGGAEVVFTLPAEVEVEKASVIGRVVDSGGLLPHPGALRINLQYHQRNSFRSGEIHDVDHFRFEQVDPGRYRVVVFSNEDGVAASEWFELAPGQRHDLGEIHTHPGGVLVVRLVTKGGAAPERPTASIGRGFLSRGMTWDGTHFRAEGIPPGKQPLQIYGRGIFIPDREVEIVAGQTRELSVEVVPGVRVPFEIHPPLGSEWKEIRYRARSAAGELVFDDRLRNGTGLVLPCKTFNRMPLGAFTLEAESDSGKRWSGSLEIRDRSAEIERILIDLR